MNKQKRMITKADIIPLEKYSKDRPIIKKNIIQLKKNRRVFLGPYATFYFESFETMLLQIQEMLYIEKGGDKQLEDELEAYNPLVPKGKELVATLMFEIDNPINRVQFLNRVGGIERKVFIKIKEEKIKSLPENDVDRTSEEGKASSVQFIHFHFNDEQIKNFKNKKNDVIIGIDHKLYSHAVKISNTTREALIKDFI